MQMTCQTKNGIGVISIDGSMNASNVDEYKEQFSRWLDDEKDIKNIVANLAGVDNIDSSGLGALLGSLKKIADRSGDMRVCCLQKKPRIVFEITRAYKMFEIFDTEEEALGSY